MREELSRESFLIPRSGRHHPREGRPHDPSRSRLRRGRSRKRPHDRAAFRRTDRRLRPRARGVGGAGRLPGRLRGELLFSVAAVAGHGDPGRHLRASRGERRRPGDRPCRPRRGGGWRGRLRGLVLDRPLLQGQHSQYLAVPLAARTDRARGGVLRASGAWGVFVGHFFGPVRAVIPVVAGMFAMRQLPFQVATSSARSSGRPGSSRRASSSTFARTSSPSCATIS